MQDVPISLHFLGIYGREISVTHPNIFGTISSNCTTQYGGAILQWEIF